MSEFIRCDGCGDLVSFENMTYVNHTPLCESCQEERLYILQTNNSD